jgi:hypothetical protein
MDARVSGVSILGEEQSLDPSEDQDTQPDGARESRSRAPYALCARRFQGVASRKLKGMPGRRPDVAARAPRVTVANELKANLALPIADNLDNCEIMPII